MPVGNCLQGRRNSDSRSSFSDSKKSQEEDLEIIITSSVLNMADQFAFMQQTLLLQIFRVSSEQNNNNSNNSCEQNNNNHSSSSSNNTNYLKNNNNCPTCVPFSDTCCQIESGRSLFYEFLDSNASEHHWDSKVTEAIHNLRYQGYVCPGILVMIGNTVELEIIVDAWKRRLLRSPHHCRISQVGLSTGCTVKPILRSVVVSLPDIICLILTKLKNQNIMADMQMICQLVETDWSLASRTNNLPELIHSTLGTLIKTRKVYYTGKSGYFLVEGHNYSNGSFGNPFSRLRHSLKMNHSSLSSSSSSNSPSSSSNSPRKNFVHQEVQTKISGDSPAECSSNNSLSPDSPDSCENSSPAKSLERSQSLRIYKKSQKGVVKGGSLRLSKKDLVKLNIDYSESTEKENHEGLSKESKIIERRGSFLGKFFGKSFSSSSSKAKSLISVNKPEYGRFSAQFPPPELKATQQPIYSTLTSTNTSDFRKFRPPLYSVINKVKTDGLYNSPPPPLPYRPSRNSPVKSPSPPIYSFIRKDSREPVSCSSSSSSGPSSIESQSQCYEDSKGVVMEKVKSPKTNISSRVMMLSNHRIDTIHNNRNLTQEVIYEVESVLDSSSDTDKTVLDSKVDFRDISRNQNFKSLTAQKLMAGISFNSIDTLLEVNAAAEARHHRINESTETIDFGII